jgi:hypothetical protein
MNVDDVFLVLHHHWVMDTITFPDGRQRLQVAFLVLIIACTASRPGALVYVARNEKKVEVTQLARITRTRIRTGTITGNPVKKIAPIMTGTASRPRHYAIEISRCSYRLIRMAFETCYG